MGMKFHAPSPWESIQKAAEGARAFVAVPFIGKGAAKMLPVSTGSVLVTRFTRESVKAGQVDPREVIKLIRRGVGVFNRPDLHAKVYVFPRRAFIGSANVSRTSAGLVEACLETTDRQTIFEAREFVRSLSSDLVTLEYAKSFVSLYPKDGERYFGVPLRARKAALADSGRFWVSPVERVEFSAEEQEAARLGRVKARKALSESAGRTLVELAWHGRHEFRPGDWVLRRFNAGRGFQFECPERVVYVQPVNGGGGRRRIVFLERMKWQRDLSSAVIRTSHKELVAKLCFEGDRPRRLVSERDISRIRRLWKAFRS